MSPLPGLSADFYSGISTIGSTPYNACMYLVYIYILYKYNLPVSDYGTDYVAMAFSTYGNMLLFYFNALLGVGGVVLLAMILEAINALKQIGQRTITILVIHGQIQFLFQLFWDLLKETYGITVNAMLKCFICVLAVLVISIPFDYILRK